jgi:hypothetical protein
MGLRTALPSEPQTSALALQEPIYAKVSPRAEKKTLPERYIVLRGDEVLYVTVQYPAGIACE